MAELTKKILIEQPEDYWPDHEEWVMLGYWDENDRPVYRFKPVVFPTTDLGRLWLWRFVETVLMPLGSLDDVLAEVPEAGSRVREQLRQSGAMNG